MEISKTKSAHLRSLICDSAMDNQLFSFLPGLANLRILAVNDPRLDISVLAHLQRERDIRLRMNELLSPNLVLTDLITLRLANVPIWFSRSYTLAQVRELQLLDFKHGRVDQSIGDILNPATVPAVRALAYWTKRVYIKDANELLRSLCHQLEVLSIDRHVAQELGADVFAAINDKTLFDVPRDVTRGRSGMPMKHLRIHFDPTQFTPDELSKVLESVQALINPKSTASIPDHLYLPPIPLCRATAQHNIARTVNELVQACDAHQVTIVCEKQAIDWTLDSGISKDFWRRMREAKV